MQASCNKQLDSSHRFYIYIGHLVQGHAIDFPLACPKALVYFMALFLYMGVFFFIYMGGKPMGKLLYISRLMFGLYIFQDGKQELHGHLIAFMGNRISHHLMVFSMFSTACAWDTFSCSARAIISSAFGSGLSCEDSALTWVASGEGQVGRERERDLTNICQMGALYGWKK